MNKAKTIAIILMLAMVLVFTACDDTALGEPEIERWEYMIFDHLVHANNAELRERSLVQLDEKLNELGAEGWELVSNSLVESSSFRHIFTMKRRVHESA
jgi:hypothetical protein